jgi:PAS domain S-box-containing protein
MTLSLGFSRPRLRGAALMTSPTVAPALLEHLADGVLACDADGVTLTFNREAREIFGAPREHVPAQECAELYALYAPGEDRMLELAELPLAKALQGEQVREQRVEVRRAHQPRRLISCSGGPVRDRRGRLLGAVVAIRDLSRDADAELAALAGDHIPVPVIVIRAADGTIVGANAAAGRAFGYDPGALVGQPRSLLDAPIAGNPAERAAEIAGSFERDGAWTGEIEHVRSDGSHFAATATIAPYEHPLLGPLWISVHPPAGGR